MKYFITGYKGQLGYDLVRELAKRGELDITVSDLGALEEKNKASLELLEKTAIKYVPLDITDKEKVMEIIEEENPDVIIHCAAWTAVDKAEDMEEVVRKVNVLGTKNITDASIKVDSKSYTCNCYVFEDYKDGYYTENDK